MRYRPSAGNLKEKMRNDLFLTALARMGLLQPGERPAMTPLTGGVSSEIVRVDLVRHFHVGVEQRSEALALNGSELVSR